MADSLEELYEKYNILSDAKENVSQHSQEYLQCIARTKGNDKEKKLAPQIIAKFFKHFPDLQEKALNALLDLCEDDESMIRIPAMKVLPLLCKDVKAHVTKIADILAQLLQLEDHQDYNTACNALTQVYKEDPINTVKAIANNIQTTEESTVREKCINFLYKKLIKIEEKLSPEINDILIDEGKKIIQDSSATEFCLVMPFLTTSKLTKTISGQQELINLVAERAEIDRDFEPLEESAHNSDRIVMCVDYILPLFNANVESTKFVKFYCDQILPQWDSIAKLENGSALQHQLLKQLAEMSPHCGKLENPSLYVVQIFDKLKNYMPLPPEDADIEKMPNLDFTTVECLLYAFHRLARQCPDFLTADPAVLKDFRSRLNYFSRGVGGCKRSLEKINIRKQEDEKIKIAPAVLDNITALIKDLFYTTPVYKCNIQLSFKSLDKSIKLSPDKNTGPQKRHAPIQFDSNTSTKQVRSNKGADNVKLYIPPSGKFSNNFQSYDRMSGRGRGRGSGRGMRGRGSMRGWRN